MARFEYSVDSTSPPSNSVSVINHHSGTGSSEFNQFLHGRHSFNTANQLQSYMERMAPPAANVNITNVAHFQVGSNRGLLPASSSTGITPMRENNGLPTILPSTVARTPANIPRGGLPNASTLTGRIVSNLGFSNGSVVPATNYGSFTTRTSTLDPPPPPGFERSYMVVVCDLHNREEAGSEPPPQDGGINLNGISIGHCGICRRVVAVDSRGRAVRDF